MTIQKKSLKDIFNEARIYHSGAKSKVVPIHPAALFSN